jgi:hypothetical protein
MGGEGFWTEILASFAGSFGTSLAHELVEWLRSAVQTAGEDEPPAAVSVSALEVRSYLRGSAFAGFAARKVEAWAANELASMSELDRTAVAMEAAAAGGDAKHALVRALAVRRFGPGFAG